MYVRLYSSVRRLYSTKQWYMYETMRFLNLREWHEFRKTFPFHMEKRIFIHAWPVSFCNRTLQYVMYVNLCSKFYSPSFYFLAACRENPFAVFGKVKKFPWNKFQLFLSFIQDTVMSRHWYGIVCRAGMKLEDSFYFGLTLSSAPLRRYRKLIVFGCLLLRLLMCL